jgi:hypothetical protein
MIPLHPFCGIATALSIHQHTALERSGRVSANASRPLEYCRTTFLSQLTYWSIPLRQLSLDWLHSDIVYFDPKSIHAADSPIGREGCHRHPEFTDLQGWKNVYLLRSYPCHTGPEKRTFVKVLRNRFPSHHFVRITVAVPLPSILCLMTELVGLG